MTPYLLAAAPLLLFWAALGAYVLPWRLWLDLLSKGKNNPNGGVFQLAAISILQEPDEWRVGEDQAVFPKEGAWRIIITREGDKLYLQQDSVEGKLLVEGHYALLLRQALDNRRSYRRYKAAARVLIPEEHQILLENLNVKRNDDLRVRLGGAREHPDDKRGGAGQGLG